MATNADQDAVDDSKEVTEDDLRDLKYGDDDVETSQEEDETDGSDETEDESEETGAEDEQTDDQAEAEEDPDAPQFVKEFPNIKGDTPEEYAKNLEIAYKNSFAELHRLRESGNKTEDEGEETDTKIDASDPVALYVKQKMDEEITDAYTNFAKHYSQVNDPAEYDKFVKKVAILQKVSLAEGRISPPKELYNDAAAALHWEPADMVDSKDKLGNALKDRAAVSKTTSATKKKVTKSKVTDAMIAANRLMYPDKMDAQIREELEPFVQ